MALRVVPRLEATHVNIIVNYSGKGLQLTYFRSKAFLIYIMLVLDA